MWSLGLVLRQGGTEAGRGRRGLSPEYWDVRLERLPRLVRGEAGGHHGGGRGHQRGGGQVDSLLSLWGRIVLVSGNPVQVAVPDTAAQRPLPAPGSVGSDGDLPAVVCLRVVDVQLQRPSLVGLYQTEEILALVEDTVRS